jgi:hypothetical protein
VVKALDALRGIQGHAFGKQLNRLGDTHLRTYDNSKHTKEFLEALAQVVTQLEGTVHSTLRDVGAGRCTTEAVVKGDFLGAQKKDRTLGEVLKSTFFLPSLQGLDDERRRFITTRPEAPANHVPSMLDKGRCQLELGFATHARCPCTRRISKRNLFGKWRGISQRVDGPSLAISALLIRRGLGV